jgi:hypothetical protein
MRWSAAAFVLALAACGSDAPPPVAPSPSATSSAAPIAGSAATTAPAPDAAAEAAAAAITADDLRRVVAEIADDRYGGRAPGSAGDKMARDFIAAELERIGFEPGAADGGWE